MEAFLHFAAELVAFLLLFFLLYRYVWPFVRRMMEERQDAVTRQVEESEEASRKLEEAQRRFDQAVAEARAEAAKIRDDARADATRISEELREQAEREVVRIRQRGEEELAAQRDQVVRQLRAEIGALSFETAQRMVTDSLADESRRGATVDTFLSELDRLPGGSAAGSQDGVRAQPRAEAGLGGTN